MSFSPRCGTRPAAGTSVLVVRPADRAVLRGGAGPRPPARRDSRGGRGPGQVVSVEPPGRSPPGAPGTLVPPDTSPDAAPVETGPPDGDPRRKRAKPPLPSARRVCSRTASTMITPRATAWAELDRLLSTKTLLSVWKMRTP